MAHHGPIQITGRAAAGHAAKQWAALCRQARRRPVSLPGPCAAAHAFAVVPPSCSIADKPFRPDRPCADSEEDGKLMRVSPRARCPRCAACVVAAVVMLTNAAAGRAGQHGDEPKDRAGGPNPPVAQDRGSREKGQGGQSRLPLRGRVPDL